MVDRFWQIRCSAEQFAAWEAAVSAAGLSKTAWTKLALDAHAAAAPCDGCGGSGRCPTCGGSGRKEKGR